MGDIDADQYQPPRIQDDTSDPALTVARSTIMAISLKVRFLAAADETGHAKEGVQVIGTAVLPEGAPEQVPQLDGVGEPDGVARPNTWGDSGES